jgi:hypothetical protein
MKIESSVTSISWIPSAAIAGVTRIPAPAEPPARRVLGQRRQRQPGRQVMHPQRAKHRLRDQHRILDRGQQCQPGAIGEAA